MRDGSITDDEALAAQQLNERMLEVSQEPIVVRAQSIALQLAHVEDDAVLRLVDVDHDSSCALQPVPHTAPKRGQHYGTPTERACGRRQLRRVRKATLGTTRRIHR